MIRKECQLIYTKKIFIQVQINSKCYSLIYSYSAVIIRKRFDRTPVEKNVGLQDYDPYLKNLGFKNVFPSCGIGA